VVAPPDVGVSVTDGVIALTFRRQVVAVVTPLEL
jgi:hypothetical protein